MCETFFDFDFPRISKVVCNIVSLTLVSEKLFACRISVCPDTKDITNIRNAFSN